MAGYIGAAPVPQATQHRQAFTATAAQTSFATAGYTSQFIDVYLNGIKLAGEDYTATNGSDIVLAIGAATGDILEYVAYTPFEVADQTFTGTTTLTDSGAAPLVVNRTTTQGELIDIKSDGVSVGAIGTQLIRPFLASNDGGSGCGVLMGGSSVLPTDRFGNPNDALTNLGSPTNRLKDIYMSGDAAVGGTVAATGNVTGNIIQGNIMATRRVSGGYGTSNAASYAVTSTSENATYQVHATRVINSTNLTTTFGVVLYTSASRAIINLYAGVSVTITESGGVISANNTGAAAAIYLSVTRVY
jgi:hypothetical protein